MTVTACIGYRASILASMFLKHLHVKNVTKYDSELFSIRARRYIFIYHYCGMTIHIVS